MSPLPEPAVLAQKHIIARAGNVTLPGLSTQPIPPSPAPVLSQSTAPSASTPSSQSTGSADPGTTSTSTSLSLSATSSAISFTSSDPISASVSYTAVSSPSATSPASAGDNANNSPGTQSHHKGISSGAIAGIVIVCLLVAVAGIVFFVRKSSLRKRQQHRITWTRWSTARFPAFTFRRDVSEKTDTPQPADLAFKGRADLGDQMPISPVFDTDRMVQPLALPPLARNSTSPAAPAPSSAAAGSYAAVQFTFIPNLPDELSISVGEVIRVLAEYDDGWALCVGTQGEQGVVPLECLKRDADKDKAQPHASQSFLGEGKGVWRMSKRASSLRPESTRYSKP